MTYLFPLTSLKQVSMCSTPLRSCYQLSNPKGRLPTLNSFWCGFSSLSHKAVSWGSGLILLLPLPLLQLPYANDSKDTSSVQTSSVLRLLCLLQSHPDIPKQLRLRKSKTQFNNFVPAKAFLNPLLPILVRGTSHLLHSVAQTWKVTENNTPSLKLLQLSNSINFTFQICV